MQKKVNNFIYSVYRIVLLVMLLSGSLVTLSVAQSIANNGAPRFSREDFKIEVYVGGKKYQSFDDYKKSQFQDSLTRALSVEEALDKAVVKSELENRLIDVDPQDLTEQELMEIVREVLKEKKQKTDQDESFYDELKMLKDYSNQHKDFFVKEVDLSAMKTIQIRSEKEKFPQNPSQKKISDKNLK